MMKQLFNLMQDGYEIQFVKDLESPLLDMFGSFIEQEFEAELEQHSGHSRYNYQNKSASNPRNGRQPKTIKTQSGGRNKDSGPT